MFATRTTGGGGGRFGINFDDDDEDELMLVDEEEEERIVGNNNQDRDDNMQESSSLGDYKKFMIGQHDVSLSSNYSNPQKSFKQSIMHDYIGHPIQNICVLFYNNQIPGVTSSFTQSSNANFTELILAISTRNTVRFYSLLIDTNEMKLVELSDNEESKSITLENNIKFMKVIDDILIVCDERGTIQVYRYNIHQIPPSNISKLLPEHGLEINSPFRPFEMCSDDSNLMSFDAEALIEGDGLKISVVLGTSNGIIYYSSLATTSRKPSQFAVLREVKYQHKSMLPILGLVFPVKKMVTTEIPILLYYRTLNCVFSIDVNDNSVTQSKYEPNLVMKTKERITSLSTHPLQPNFIVVGLGNGTLICKDQQATWDRSISPNAIKAIEFGRQTKSVLVGDEQGFIYNIDLETINQKSSQSESDKTSVLIENLDGNDILHVEYLAYEDKILVINPNGRINLILH